MVPLIWYLALLNCSMGLRSTRSPTITPAPARGLASARYMPYQGRLLLTGSVTTISLSRVPATRSTRPPTSKLEPVPFTLSDSANSNAPASSRTDADSSSKAKPLPVRSVKSPRIRLAMVLKFMRLNMRIAPPPVSTSTKRPLRATTSAVPTSRSISMLAGDPAQARSPTSKADSVSTLGA